MGGGYQPIIEEQEEPEGIREEGEVEIETAETEEDSVIMRGDVLPKLELSKFNTKKRRRTMSRLTTSWESRRATKKTRRTHQDGKIRVYDGPKDTYRQYRK